MHVKDAVLALTAGSLIGFVAWRTWNGSAEGKPQQQPEEKKATPRLLDPQVVELWVHPIKGVKGMSVDEWPLEERGLLFDREWAVVELDTGNAVSSNKHQRLATATATIDADKRRLRVTAPSMPEPLVLSIGPASRLDDHDDESKRIRNVTIFGMSGTALEEGEEAKQWFSTLLRRPVVLCRIRAPRLPRESPNHVGTSAPSDVIGFHDYATLHIICRDGVRWLQQSMPSHVQSKLQLTTQQFRANVVVDGVPFPEEDSWQTLTIGTVPMRVAKQSGRCVIPTHDADGVRGMEFEPTATLRRLRATPHRHQLHWESRQPNFMFGLDLFHDTRGTLRVGDRLLVTATQEEPHYLPPNWQEEKQ